MNCLKYMGIVSLVYFLSLLVVLLLISFSSLKLDINLLILATLPYPMCMIKIAFEKGIKFSFNELFYKSDNNDEYWSGTGIQFLLGSIFYILLVLLGVVL